MSQIKDGLQKVAPITLVKRVWTVVKDRNGATPQVVASILKETSKRTSGILAGFEQRGMMTRSRLKTRGNHTSYFYDIPSKFTEYELLPVPKPAIKTIASDAASALVPLVPAAIGRQEPPDANNMSDINIDTLTIAQARVLWKQLNQLFKQ